MEDKISIEFEGTFEGDVIRTVITLELSEPLEMLGDGYSNKLSKLYKMFNTFNFTDDYV